MPIQSLSQLPLDDAERVALGRNGFIACEQRRYSRVYKLRFRVQGRQRVRFLGTDPAAVELLQKELAVWQARPRAERALRQAERNAHQAIRAIKPRLEPYVRAAGLKFHGRTIRRPRRRLPSSVEMTPEFMSNSVHNDFASTHFTNRSFPMKEELDENQAAAMAQNKMALDAYKASALQEDDSLQACMHLVNATLMESLHNVHASTMSGPDSTDFNSLLRGVETETKVVREIEKVARFVTRHEADNMMLLRAYQK